MRKKDNMGIQLKEMETFVPPVSRPRLSVSKGKVVKRDELGKSLHNKSEKCRRSLMKRDYDRLRSMVPHDEEIEKQTMLTLLHKARIYINTLEEKERKYKRFKQELIREQKYLKRRLDQMQHLVKGGAIGLGNTLLLSVPTPPPNPSPQPKNSVVLPETTAASQETLFPPILKRKQLLLSSNDSEPQIVITSVMSRNIVYPENICLMIDEMEHLEGVEGYQIVHPKDEYYEEYISDELIETEIVDSMTDYD